MRLHRLEMTAFGPFAGTTTVDFDALAADGVFLLHGQTGAGKSTVLDAVAFALYGTVPGVRKDAKRLRSDHAPAAVAPQVALEATIAGRRLRIVRRPEFRRPKRRGDGERVEPARATLEWLDGSGVHLSRIHDIGDEVNALLGMSADQFFQVVLLPQGEFARFLRAENEDREALLERLFATERYAAAEQWLTDRRRASGAEIAVHAQQIERLMAQIGQVVRTTGPDDPDDAVGWAETCLGEARTAASAARIIRAREDRLARAAAAEVHAARRTAEARQRATDARQRLAELELSAADRASAADELARARRAAPIAATIADAERARRHAEAMDRECAAAATDLAALPGGSATADPAAAARAWSAELGGLDMLATELARVDELTEQRDGWLDRRRVLGRRRDELAVRVGALPGELVAAEHAAAAAETAAATVPIHRADVERGADALWAATELVDRREARRSAEELVTRRRAQHADAREQLLDLRESRLAGMAAELAGELVPDTPCAVCGSPTHPAPARPGVGSVSEADEQAAARAEEAAAGARDAAIARLAAIERDIDVLVIRCGDRDPATLRVALAADEHRLAGARAAAAQAESAAAAVAQLRDEQVGLHDEHRAVEAELGSIAERIESADQRIAEIRARVAEACGEDGTLELRRARLDRLIRAEERWRRARADAEASGSVARIAGDRAVEHARRAGFVDPADVATAVRSAERTAALEALLTAAERHRLAAEAVLADPAIRAAATGPDVDPAACEATAQAADAARDGAIAVADRAEQCVRQLEELIVPLTVAADELRPARARHAELAEIAELVAGRGSNSRRMTLRSYVLAARLEEVAEAASIRLRGMSGGRFEFVHSDVAGPRGRRGGLGLHVRDDYTGSVRPAKTLSGGETFMASLALALGLADTVAAESGGRVLDTLFIDEGFGSLDDESLDAVMAVLDELRAGGRVVGIVSHLDELRQRIPCRLHVIRGRNGSRVVGPIDQSASAGAATLAGSGGSAGPAVSDTSSGVVRTSTRSPR